MATREELANYNQEVVKRKIFLAKVNYLRNSMPNPGGLSPRRHMISSQDYSAKIKDTEEKLKHLEDLQT